MVEQSSDKRSVVGSNPTVPTTKSKDPQLGRSGLSSSAAKERGSSPGGSTKVTLPRARRESAKLPTVVRIHPSPPREGEAVLVQPLSSKQACAGSNPVALSKKTLLWRARNCTIMVQATRLTHCLCDQRPPFRVTPSRGSVRSFAYELRVASIGPMGIDGLLEQTGPVQVAVVAPHRPLR